MLTRGTYMKYNMPYKYFKVIIKSSSSFKHGC